MANIRTESGELQGVTDGSWDDALAMGFAIALQTGASVIVTEASLRATCTPEGGRMVERARREAAARFTAWEKRQFESWQRQPDVGVRPNTTVDYCAFVR